MSEPKSKNIVWHHATITKEDREKLFSQKGVVIWFTGLSGSGKSTLANAVEASLFERGCHTYILDGDNIRHGLNKDLGFSPEGPGRKHPAHRRGGAPLCPGRRHCHDRLYLTLPG